MSCSIFSYPPYDLFSKSVFRSPCLPCMSLSFILWSPCRQTGHLPEVRPGHCTFAHWDLILKSQSSLWSLHIGEGWSRELCIWAASPVEGKSRRKEIINFVLAAAIQFTLPSISNWNLSLQFTYMGPQSLYFYCPSSMELWSLKSYNSENHFWIEKKVIQLIVINISIYIKFYWAAFSCFCKFTSYVSFSFERNCCLLPQKVSLQKCHGKKYDETGEFWFWEFFWYYCGLRILFES